MTTFITPRILYVCYVISVVAILAIALAFEVAIFATHSVPGDRGYQILFGGVLVPIATVVLIIITRVSTELVLVIFRIEEHLRRMRDVQVPERAAWEPAPTPAPIPRTTRPRIEPRF